MRIGVYSNGYPKLSQTFVDKQINALVENGCDVTVLTDKQSNSPSIVNSDLDIIDFSPKANSNLARVFVYFFLFVLASLKGKGNLAFSVSKDDKLAFSQKLSIVYALAKGIKLSYDVILVHFGNFGYYISTLKSCGVLRGKVAIIFHGYEISRKKVLSDNVDAYRACFDSCDMFLPVSKLWKEKLIKMGCPSRKVYVSRMGIDLDDFVYKTANSDSEVFKLIQVGRLTKKKGILDTINAIALLPKDSNIHLDVVGSGELENEALELVRKLGLFNKIKFHGPLPNTMVKKLLFQSNAYILPSKVADDGDMEGVPVALMEAMAVGLPVISTYHSGIPELIDDGVSGFLVNEGDVEALSNTVYTVSRYDQSSLNKITVSARQKIEKQFNNDKEVKALIDLIS
ncbi:glycosyltransferase [Vibrio sp. EA2]|uniref:glycosyltransferase n=1 Tax=Vibrio sp. EA2 TaxID=3079860 RepID=UPI00294A0AED|nr:glycosyltransferase [Vibrio sp. EA2]MDV6253341.1 glycosyltransferase [Vibrio sp. EA2]